MKIPKNPVEISAMSMISPGGDPCGDVVALREARDIEGIVHAVRSMLRDCESGVCIVIDLDRDE